MVTLIKAITIPFQFIWLYLMEFVKMFLPLKRKTIAGDVALVTGAGRGLGKDIAIVLAEKGCKVVVVDINYEAVVKTASEINSKGKGSAIAIKCDVSNWDDIVMLRNQVELDVAPVDILVNNAAVIVMGPFMNNTQEDIERSMAVNVNGVVYMTRIFLERMIQRKKGHIVTITSSAAYYPLPWAVVYATTKAASAAFMSVLAEQLRFEKHDEYIKTTSILPYIINTDPTKGLKYTKKFLEPRFVAEQTVEALQKNIQTTAVPSSLMFQLKSWILTPLSVQHFIREVIFNERQFYDDKKSINTVLESKVVLTILAEE